MIFVLQPVGPRVRAHQVIAGGLRRRIRARRIVARFFREQALVPERAVHFVGADVMKEPAFVRPARSTRLEQIEGAIDVRAHEFARPGDAAIDVALGREMDHELRIAALEETLDGAKVGDVDALELVVGRTAKPAEVRKVCGVGQLVSVDEMVLRMPRNHQIEEVRADEAGAARDQDHHYDLYMARFPRGQLARALQRRARGKQRVSVPFASGVWLESEPAAVLRSANRPQLARAGSRARSWRRPDRARSAPARSPAPVGARGRFPA